MALVLQAFSHGDRVKAMGWWALVGAGGPVLGVTIGAPIIQYFGWRALFWGELPLMAIAAVLAVVVLPARDRPDGQARTGRRRRRSPGRARGRSSTGWARSPWPAAVTAGLLALNEAPSWGFTAPATLAVFTAGIAVGVVFVLHERRPPAAHPAALLPDAQLRLPPRVPDLRQLLLHGGLLPLPHPDGAGLRLQRDPGRAGVHRPTADVLDRGAHRRLCRGQGGGAAVGGGRGGGPIVASMVVFTQLGAQPSLVVIVVALALSGVGNGLSTPSTASSASNEVAGDELGVMSAAQQLITQIGIVAGIQVMVTVQASATAGWARWPRSTAPSGGCGRRRTGRGVWTVHARHPGPREGPAHPSRAAGPGAPLMPGRRPHSVMARMRAAISAAAGSGVIDWRAISLAMSPSTLILPDMNACMPAWGLPSTRMALATS